MKMKGMVVIWAGAMVVGLMAMPAGVPTAVAQTLDVRTVAEASVLPSGASPSQDLSSSGTAGTVRSSAQVTDAIPNASAAAASQGELGFGHFRGWSTADSVLQGGLYNVGTIGHSFVQGLSTDSILINPVNPVPPGTRATVTFQVSISGQVSATNTGTNVWVPANSCWGFSAYTSTSTTSGSVSGCYVANSGYSGDSLGTHTLSFDVELGTQSVLMLNYDTSSELRYYMADLTIGEGHTKALFGSTFLWGGISQVLDASGNPISFTLTSESGTDWTQPAAVPPALYASFPSSGVWQYDGSTWTRVTPYSPSAMAASGSILYGRYDNGIWQYDGAQWTQLTSYSPAAMAAAGSLLYGKYDNGIWQYNGSTWTQLTPYSPEAMVATGSLLYGKYDNGIWQYNGSTWTQLTPYSPSAMVASGSLLYGKYDNGIWQYNGSTWSQLTPYSPTDMVAAGSLLYATYDNGIWLYNGSTWSQATPNIPEGMVAAGSLIYGDYGPSGIWQYDGSTWTQITPNDPTSMVGN
jgi:hypothetical protein